MTYSRELKLALELAQEAGKVQVGARLDRTAVDRKSDKSPVTDVDRRCEDLIRQGLLRAFPDDGFLGEESGETQGKTGRTWIVDPLDGTRPFIRGIPTYSSLIALEEGDEPAVGVIHLPAMRETYWASKGSGAFFNGESIRVSTTTALSHAMGSSLGYVEKPHSPMSQRLIDLMREWDYAYGFMDNYSYACVAAGRIDVCVNMLDKPWDCAAAACIVAEAGGSYSDVHGARSFRNGSVVVSNGLLHAQVVAYLNEIPSEPSRT
jgi:histidinol-phosphatase